MKGLLGFVVFAMVMVCISYADAAELTTSQTEQQAEKAVAGPDVVLIVDRNPKVQELKVFENGNTTTPTKVFPVSTGRETFDFNEGNYKVNPYCSFTETSEEFAKANNLSAPKDFKPTVLREMNVSDTWSSKDAQGNITSKTKMPNSVFFNGGTAFHSIDDTTEYGRSAALKLGPKDSAANGGSGACVRLKPEDSKYVFDLFAVKDSQGNYSKFDPRKTEDCAAKPGVTPSHKCTDPMQWPVTRKKLNVQIKVIDTRSAEDQAKARQACQTVRSAFLADKAKCLTDKLKPQPIVHRPVEKPKRNRNFFERIGDGIGSIFRGGRDREDREEEPVRTQVDTNAPFDLKQALRELSAEERSRYNEECNRAGHQKIKSGQLMAGKRTSPAPQPAQQRVANADKPVKTEVRRQNTGLWMEQSGR